MDVKVGIQNTAREVVIDATLTPDEVSAALTAALKDGGLFELSDEKGRRVVIPAAAIAYVDIAKETPRRVGFGAS